MINETAIQEKGLFDELSNQELTGFYNKERLAFQNLLKRSMRISHGSEGIKSTSDRMFWASVLFTRILITALSVNRLLPYTKRGEHWDFSAVASLVRNLAEAYLFYYWLCEDDVDENVRQGRLTLLNLYDHGSRRRMFNNNTSNADEVFDDLEKKFDSNPYLAAYDKRKRKEALKGEKTPFIHDDVLERMGVDKDHFRVIYRFFSQHTHIGPVSFYRMVNHDRGTGVETRHEKKYIIFAIQFARDLIERAISGHLTIFPDAETRKPLLTRHQIELNVELAQGRVRRGKR